MAAAEIILLSLLLCRGPAFAAPLPGNGGPAAAGEEAPPDKRDYKVELFDVYGWTAATGSGKTSVRAASYGDKALAERLWRDYATVFGGGDWYNSNPLLRHEMIMLTSAGRTLILRSQHRITEQGGVYVFTSSGPVKLNGRTREEVLRADSPAYVARREAFDRLARECEALGPGSDPAPGQPPPAAMPPAAAQQVGPAAQPDQGAADQVKQKAQRLALKPNPGRGFLRSEGFGRFVFLCSFILGPAATAFLASWSGRSVLIWTVLAFFLPLALPFAAIIFSERLVTHYHLFVTLLGALACPVFIWRRGADAAPERPARGRALDLTISLAFLAFLAAVFVLLAIAFFPAQH